MVIVSSVTTPRQVVLPGCLTRYGYGMTTGGPAIMVWGWPIAGIMTLFAGLAMAGVRSSFPTAGGLYYSPGRAGACGSGAGHSDRGRRGQAAAGDRHRRPAVLRDVLEYRELADDPRVPPDSRRRLSGDDPAHRRSGRRGRRQGRHHRLAWPGHPASAQRTCVPQRQRTAQQPLPANTIWRNAMAKTSPGTTRTAAGEQHLHRAIGLPALTMINIGGIIGSGWLLGALTAAKVAGGGSLISWLLGAAVLAVLALVHAELGSTYPVSGGTARFPFLAFGALGGFTGGWMSWLYNVTVAPIEAEASLSYLDSHYTGLHFINSSGLLTGRGILAGAGFLLLFVVINAMGVKWLSDTNAVAVIWKVFIPLLTVVALMTTRFHASNFTAGGGFAPYGFHGVFAALPLGVIFAEAGFEMCIQVGGEAKNPQKNIPRAVILSLIICTLIYLLLEVTFVGALNPAQLLHGWANPIGGVQNFGPYATLATAAGLGWLTTLLLIDAVISPAGAGLVYIGTSSRLSYALGRNGYFPPAISRISKRGVPFTSIIISFVAGMLFFLPFPSWSGLVELATSALVFMYALAPLALGGLRREDPGRHRPYRLPAAGVLSPLAFVFANLLVYFAGFSTVLWLEVLIVLGFIAFAFYQFRLPAARRTVIDPRAALWVLPWLAGLLILSWLGRYNGSPPTVFGVTLLATNHLPNWWDLAAIAAFSLVIYYWAVHSTLPHQRVSAAVEQVETEASVELEKSLV
jgi:amino acid transporter